MTRSDKSIGSGSNTVVTRSPPPPIPPPSFAAGSHERRLLRPSPDAVIIAPPHRLRTDGCLSGRLRPLLQSLLPPAPHCGTGRGGRGGRCEEGSGEEERKRRPAAAARTAGHSPQPAACSRPRPGVRRLLGKKFARVPKLPQSIIGNNAPIITYYKPSNNR